MRVIYEKVTHGDPITDQEIDEGIKFFDDLNKKLMTLGPVFRLSSTEVNRVLTLLKDFKRARETAYQEAGYK